ncbi:RNA 2'-phosphotransferase, partial [Zooshikella sp. RANM57]|uniref:RNA 2'-phosphotransferase n=1 Tax=Zooshikella sp. RANM57 TaxID=3425863 RepID=UPI003D6E02A6
KQFLLCFPKIDSCDNTTLTTAFSQFLSLVQPTILSQKLSTVLMEKGITKQQRHHVHLTESIAVGKAVGGRYGKPVILAIDAQAMLQEGFVFFKTTNNVWLVEEVPPTYIRAC